MKVRVLRSALSDFRNPSKERAHTAAMVLAQSIAHIMDAAGTWRSPEPGDRVPQDLTTVNYYSYNGRVYEFSKGLFPEYDELMVYLRKMESYNESYGPGARAAGRASPSHPEPPLFTPELEGWIESRVQEALGVLGETD